MQQSTTKEFSSSAPASCMRLEVLSKSDVILAMQSSSISHRLHRVEGSFYDIGIPTDEFI